MLDTARHGQIQVVTRIAQIVGLLAGGRGVLRAREVASELDLERSTVHRYLASLDNVGLLARNEEDGSYAAGPLMVRFAAAVLGGSRVLELAEPYMRSLAEEAHETVVLGLWGGHGPVVARVVEDGTRLVQIVVRLGSTLPLDSAQAQVFLAYMPDRTARERLLAPLSVLRRRELEERVAQVRREGIAINSRVIEGIRAIAAPVLDERGIITATMAFVGTVSAIPESSDSGLARALAEKASNLSRRLGYGGLREVSAG